MRRAPWTAAAAVLAAGAAVFALAPAASAAGPKAVPGWSMVPMVRDADGDGAIDGDGGFPKKGALSVAPSTVFVGAGNHRAQPNERLIGGMLSWYLSPGGYPVRLDACRSRGDAYRWRITGPGTDRTTPERKLAKSSCKQTVTLPEGSYRLELIVRAGKGVDRSGIDAQVSNILIVALGDSYASGEGTPRNVAAWLRQGGAFAPYWDDDPCHRSVLAGPAQAALALERSTPKTSVTLVFAACAGAKVDGGILGPQRAAQQSASQLDQVRSVIGDRPVDIVTISIGGNDVGFTDILTTCLTASDCPIVRAPRGVLAGYPTLQAGVQGQLGRFSAQLPGIAACISAAPSCRTPLRLAPQGRVIPMLYPDLTRRADGQPCTYLTMGANEFSWARSALLVPGPGPDAQFRASSGQVLNLPLANGTLNSVLASTTSLGWAPALGTWGASGDSAVGHGLCAGNDAWSYGLTALSGFTSASFHPNIAGQNATAAQLLAAFRS